AWGVRQRRAGRRARLPLPPVRFRAGTVLASLASAMIDVSDGLVQDLGHVCRASGVGAVIDLDRLPVVRPCAALGRRGWLLAATGGEDYELLFTVPASRAGQLARLRLGCACTRIGTIVRGRGVSLRDGAGHVVPTPAPGFDHFT
ncbi:MAG TPA: AIR synthase-related protein, partial [Candidatus Limnocylindria bacterium]|nr:AIR synthase-related protein [Candidatus Limnocylindria bacterium]